jgi:type II secretion system protein N
MGRLVGTRREWFGYGLFGLLVLTCALYLRFPSAEVGDYLDRSLKGINADLSFSATLIKPWPPLQLKFTEPEVVSDRADIPLVVVEDLIAGPKIISLLQGKQVYTLRGAAYSGEFSGRLQRRTDTAGFGEGELSLAGIDLAKYNYLPELLGRQLGGILDGSISFKSSSGRLLDSGGQTQLRVSEGRITLLQPLLGLDAVVFDVITVDAALEKRILSASMELAGPELQGSMTGTIRVMADIGQSRLAFKGVVEPQSQLYQQHPQAAAALNLLKNKMKNGRYSFAVSGTVQKPEFSLL